MEAPVSVNLSIKDVPVGIADALRERARRNHRSIQGELMAMLEAHLGVRFRADELLQQVRNLGLQTPDDATASVRDDRDAR